jgi:hypothetical protein
MTFARDERGLLALTVKDYDKGYTAELSTSPITDTQLRAFTDKDGNFAISCGLSLTKKEKPAERTPCKRVRLQRSLPRTAPQHPQHVQLLDLPPEVQELILLELPPRSLASACTASNSFESL